MRRSRAVRTSLRLVEDLGAVAQLGERGLCKSEVVGSNPISSTKKQVGGSLKASENESVSTDLDFSIDGHCVGHRGLFDN